MNNPSQSESYSLNRSGNKNHASLDSVHLSTTTVEGVDDGTVHSLDYKRASKPQPTENYEASLISVFLF